MRQIKAMQVLSQAEVLKKGQGVSWTIYDGEDILDARAVENYVNSFFKTGCPMPIPVPAPYASRRIDILSVETTYNDSNKSHKVVIEGEII